MRAQSHVIVHYVPVIKNFMKASISILCLSFVFFSCVSKTKEVVERETASVQLIKQDLMTSMPGELLAFEDKLVWFDLNPDSFLHVEDKLSGKTLIEGGKLGQGPEEFTAPYLSWFSNNKILVSDCFADKACVLTLDSLKRICSLDIPTGKQAIRCVGHNQFIRMVINDKHPFAYWDSDNWSGFGKYPIEKSVSNGYDVFQGIISFNPYNNCLVYSIPNFSYIALYKKEGDSFKEIWEKQLSDVEYDIVNDSILRVNGVKRPAPSAIALTKDYIITIERDSETKEVSITETPEKGRARRFTKAPQTLFVYDYNFNLMKILHTKMPMFRLASTGNDNDVYFIGVKGEFCIGKCAIN